MPSITTTVDGSAKMGIYKPQLYTRLAQVGLDHLGMIERAVGAVCEKDLALVEGNDAIGHPSHQRQLVLDDEQPEIGATAAQVQQKPRQFFRFRRVHAGGRLVEQQARSEERSVGKECVSACKYRG